MKIKELLSLLKIENVVDKMKVAIRIKKSNPKIRQAISHYTKEKELDAISITVDYPNDDGYITISSYELVQNFGMNEIEALLYMDAVMKANKSEDKTELSLLLGRLSMGEHAAFDPLSENMMNEIQENNPEVWSEYMKLCNKEHNKNALLTKDMNSIMEEEL